MGRRFHRCWITFLLIGLPIGCQSGAALAPVPSILCTQSNVDHAVQALQNASSSQAPISIQPTVSAVRTIRSPDAPPRYISLSESIALALENGRLGDTAIRVFAIDPALAGAVIEQSLSRFDALWQSSMNWATTDEPTGIASQSAFTSNNSFNLQQANLRSRLVKPLATGGVAGITFDTEYQYGNLNSTVNPAYQPRLTFHFEQPLLQGAGVEINQLRDSHPGAVLTPFLNRGSGQGILIARIQYDKTRAHFAGQVQDLLYQVEQAYWGLYLSYWEHYSREVGYRQAYEAWRIGKKLQLQGEMTIQDVAQLEAQYHLFHVQRLDALGTGQTRPGILEAERRLRLVLGLPAEDGTRLMPVDTPTTAIYQPNWKMAQTEALSYRPELVEIRQDLKTSQFKLLRARNILLPDLRFISSYDVNSLGSRLDGGGDTNALRNIAKNNFNNWEIGLRMEMPLGFREAHSLVRIAELELTQKMIRLRDLEQQAVMDLQFSYRNLLQMQDRIPILRARRLALAEQYKALFKLFRSGEAAQLFVMLEAQRNWADALRDEQLAVVSYNIALAHFERQKGTLLTYNNVNINEGTLPTFAQNKASDHIHQREVAFRFRERHVPAFLTNQGNEEKSTSLPELIDTTSKN